MHLGTFVVMNLLFLLSLLVSARARENYPAAGSELGECGSCKT